MNEDIALMQGIYNTYEMDWMGEVISNSSILSRHHIKKKEDGGEDDIKNYALLTIDSHRFLNLIEEKYPKEYLVLNNMFLELNKSSMPPSSEYFDEVHSILKRVRKSIKNNKKRK